MQKYKKNLSEAHNNKTITSNQKKTKISLLKNFLKLEQKLNLNNQTKNETSHILINLLKKFGHKKQINNQDDLDFKLSKDNNQDLMLSPSHDM